MSSVGRGFAQRNTNITKLVPQFSGILPKTDISGAAVYTLNIPNVQSTNGIFYVDMSGVDLSGSLLNYDGEFYPFVVTDAYSFNHISIITFVLNIAAVPSVYPGLEFTIFFKNLPLRRLSGPPLLTIGIGDYYSPVPIPYIVSPPVPNLFGPSISPSITLKSDGTYFSVVSSGPAGWMGVAALSAVLAAYSGEGPL